MTIFREGQDIGGDPRQGRPAVDRCTDRPSSGSRTSQSTMHHHHIDRRTALKAAGAGLLTGLALAGSAAAHRGGLQGELAEVRSATAEYNDPANAEADGYEPEEHAVCNMGFHWPNGDLIGTVDRTRPQVLVYGEDDDGDLVLGAVEYVVPKQGEYENSPPDLFAHDGGDEVWATLELGPHTSWALHVWVHNHNPEGVFHHTNPRELFSPEGCEEH